MSSARLILLFLFLVGACRPSKGPLRFSASTRPIKVVEEAKPVPIPLGPNYASLKVHLFETSCKGCHAANGRHSDLSDRATVVAHAQDILYYIGPQGRELGDVMPPPRSKLPAPSAEVVAAFQAWVDAGMKD